MEREIGTKFDKLSNLDVALQRVEVTYVHSFKEESVQSVELTQSRLSVVRMAKDYRQSRFNFGRVLRQYQQHFKAERGWVAAATEIADAIGCDVRTIYRIIEGYERAQGLSPFVLEVLEQHGLDPAAAKNTEIVEGLLKAPQPESTTEAKKLVDEQHQKHATRKKENKAAAKQPPMQSFKQFANRIVNQFQARYQAAPREVRTSEVRLVLEMILDRLGITLEDFNQHGRLPSVSKLEMKEAA